jgi:isocitrate/isopropylmalate dehydrogenase
LTDRTSETNLHSTDKTTTTTTTTKMSPSTLYKIAAIPGDGIGADITSAAKRVLHALATHDGTFAFTFTDYDWSSKAYLSRGWYMPPDGIDKLKTHDAIYFGAVGWPSVPDHISLWNMILPIRKELNQWANVRPTRILPGTQSPLVDCRGDEGARKLDWVIVRENSEGEYAGQGGTTHGHEKYAVGTEVAIFSYVGIERIVRFAFETAKARPRRRLTMVTKSNAQRHGMVLWDKVFYDVAREYEGVVEHDKMLVDAMTVRMVNRPESLDVIVATNCELLQFSSNSFFRPCWLPAFPSVRADFLFLSSRDQCMQTSSPIWRPPSPARLESLRPPTSTPVVSIPACSSQSMAQRQISRGKASPTQSVLSGPRPRWFGGLAPGSSTPKRTR